MTSIAQWRGTAGLAAAEINLLTGIGAVLDRCEGAALVGAITKGLTFALTTGTPKIVFALLYIDGKGGVRSANGSTHDVLSFNGRGCTVGFLTGIQRRHRGVR